MENISFVRNGKEFEPTKNELKIVLDDYAKKIGELETKQAEFEDFMEAQGFEDLQDLERYIEQSIKAIEILDKKMKENQALKTRWGKLKDFIVRELREAEKTGTECDDEYDYLYLVGTAVEFYKSLLKTMRELEENND